jgi:hypothetical protein
LTVIFEPGKEYLPGFFSQQGVELVCSLPCYSQENVDKQRGKGTFAASIRALRRFNEIGYGQVDSGLVLNLVYNPVEPHLPPPQEKLEGDYKRILHERYGIVFNQLYCLSNMPITRYAIHLKLRGEYQRYMELLQTNFNLQTLDQVMCRNLVSIGWEGSVYDCDFNQMLDLAIADDLRTSFMLTGASDLPEDWAARGRVWHDDRTVIGASDAGAHLDMIDTFAVPTQVLGNGMRRHRVIGLEEAVRQLTDVPARLYGVRERGRLEVGWRADLVVFDPETIGCGPTYTRFDLPAGAGRLCADALGIEHVLVNGVEVVREGKHTGALPGTVLRSGRDTETVEVPGAL